MNEQTRIIICGSPHSGKTVFTTSLYTMLPQKYTSIIRACPDGEGVFSNNQKQNMIQLTRRKGKMTSDFVEAVKGRIVKETAPIVLIDVGGLQSKENEDIFSQADCAIILDKSQEGIESWRDFCLKQNLKILAEIQSKLGEPVKEPIETDEDTLKGTIFNLQRGENKVHDEVILRLYRKIYEIALEKGLVQKGKELLSKDNVLNMRKVAEGLGMMKNDNIEWIPNKANEIHYYTKGFVQEKKELKLFESRANWTTGIVCEVAQNEGVEDIELYDARQDRYIRTQKLAISDDIKSKDIAVARKNVVLPDKISLYITQTGNATIMQFELNPNRLILPEDMSRIQLPNINPTGKLYISGRLPLWLFASISRTYHNTEKSVLQPGTGFVQYASQNVTQNLGKIETEVQGVDFNAFLKAVKEDVDLNQEGDAR